MFTGVPAPSVWGVKTMMKNMAKRERVFKSMVVKKEIVFGEKDKAADRRAS